MHLSYANLFKRIMMVMTHTSFYKKNPTYKQMVEDRFKYLNDVLINRKFFVDRNKGNTNIMLDSNMKAIDSKMFSHVLPMYFNKQDYDDKSLYGKIINWLVELNSFIIVMQIIFLEDKNSKNLLKESYIHLLKEIEQFFRDDKTKNEFVQNII